MQFICCTDNRRNDVLDHATLNGIDFLEVKDDEKDPVSLRQTTLFLHLLKPVAVTDIQLENILIKGGERIRNVVALQITPLSDSTSPLSPPATTAKVFAVTVDKAGDFSSYTLGLVKDRQDRGTRLLDGFDQIMAEVKFSFKVTCDKDFDCKPDDNCPPEWEDTPPINYLAKDYSSFRQLILDRMALLTPDWKERNPADVGVALVELLAYAADYLSYKQDAIATEAYLGIARKRSSVRRHARLVDYFMHDGCNARAWIQVRVKPDLPIPLTILRTDNNDIPKTHFLTTTKGYPAFLKPEQYRKALETGVTVFEPSQTVTLYASNNEMFFHTWGKKSCCLPKGSTSATLIGHFSATVKVGDVLILAEKYSASTGQEADADPANRHPVKIVSIRDDYDALYTPASPPSPMQLGLPVTRIEWHTEDALPFPLCISTDTNPQVGVALGNIILADHGLTYLDGQESSLFPDTVPEPRLTYPVGSAMCTDKETANLPLRYRPHLKYAPLTQAALFDPENKKENSFYNKDQYKSAARYMRRETRTVVPAIRLFETGSNAVWEPLSDLLNAGANSKNFVVETESDGISYLRFGDSVQGERPDAKTHFKAVYRLGNGKRGNLGAHILTHIFSTDPAVVAADNFIDQVWNPLPAIGGLEPESMEAVRQYAPEAFKTQLRAVTNADYEYFAQKVNPEVQRAAATLRWTGSWKTVFLTVDRYSGLDIKPEFEEDLRNDLEKYRMAGFDLEVDAPLFVDLELIMSVCVKPGFRSDHITRALLEVFSNRVLPDGRKGVFHPDNFTFGQPVYLSRLYAAAQSVEGVQSVNITQLRRMGDKLNTVPESGIFEMGRREIARCDNDRNFPDRGTVHINITNKL